MRIPQDQTLAGTAASSVGWPDTANVTVNLAGSLPAE
jgi:hypothetical protein